MGGLGGLVLPSCFSAPFTKDAEAPSRAPCELEKRLKAFFDSVAAEWGPSLPLVQARPVWLATCGAPFVLNDPSAASLRKRSEELSFCRGQGLPGRVWATGASEIVQDNTFETIQHFSRRGLLVQEGLLETVGLPVFLVADAAGAAGPCQLDALASSPCAPAPSPVAVIEAVLASDLHAMAGSPLAIAGRRRLSCGGTASVMTSLAVLMDSHGLSCCANSEHHGFSSAPDSPLAGVGTPAWPSRWGEASPRKGSPYSSRFSVGDGDSRPVSARQSGDAGGRRGASLDEARYPEADILFGGSYRSSPGTCRGGGNGGGGGGGGGSAQRQLSASGVGLARINSCRTLPEPVAQQPHPHQAGGGGGGGGFGAGSA